jgi:hypothetical protein
MPALGTRLLKLKVGSTFYENSVSNVRLLADEKESDFITFAEAASGGAREYKLALTMKQDTDATSLWYYVWASSGTTVAVEVWPNGQNSVTPNTPTAVFPKFSGSVVISEPDGDLLGGEADKSATSFFTAETEWTFIAKPILAIA